MNTNTKNVGNARDVNDALAAELGLDDVFCEKCGAVVPVKARNVVKAELTKALVGALRERGLMELRIQSSVYPVGWDRSRALRRVLRGAGGLRRSAGRALGRALTPGARE